MTLADGNVGPAIGLVCIAGASSAIGASLVFFPVLVKRTSRRVLASSLGLSSGAMVYASFVEIFFKSVAAFEEAGMGEDIGYAYATLSFFGGVLIMKVTSSLIKWIARDNTPKRRDVKEDIVITWNDDGDEEDCFETNNKVKSHQEQVVQVVPASHYCMGCSHDPVADLEEWHMKADMELQTIQEDSELPPITSISINRKPSSMMYPDEENLEISPTGGNHEDSQGQGSETQDPSDREEVIRITLENVPRPQGQDRLFRAPDHRRSTVEEEKRDLVKMGITTALAIMLHNFPEGIATFVAALDDPRVGAVLAVAIGLHNVPEGMCVALPIYYATGSRWRAFGWGCLAGITEPIAALLGWLVLAGTMSDAAFAVVFGLVSGMMVMISLTEMIPTAHRYDPDDTVVTNSLLVGMAIIALSLVLLHI